MTQSMTGFGSAEGVCHGVRVSWQFKSVNHRFLDLSLRLPEGYGELEILCAKRLKSLFSRGRIEGTLSLKSQWEGGEELILNLPLLGAVRQLETTLLKGSEDRVGLSVAEILSWPGMTQQQSLPGIDESEEGKGFLEAVLGILEQAAHSLKTMREIEGRELASVVDGLTTELALLVDQVAENLPRVQESLEKRLQDRLSELAATTIDQERLAQEKIYFMNRLDLSEELDRLRIHLREISQVVAYAEPIGRRLDFLCQELNREANTLCSKAQDGEISRIGIDMKVLVEKLREQVQNLE
ncbi:MAG: YicC family protein [Magnetococcales bacterium]|nr:YicC family protein [Magnetococcales bacterium]